MAKQNYTTIFPTTPSAILPPVLKTNKCLREPVFPLFTHLGAWGRMESGQYSRGCSRTVSFVFEQSGAPFPARGLIILVTRCPELSATVQLFGITVSGRHFSMLTYKFYGIHITLYYITKRKKRKQLLHVSCLHLRLLLFEDEAMQLPSP